jgi:hypothetical protein
MSKSKSIFAGLVVLLAVAGCRSTAIGAATPAASTASGTATRASGTATPASGTAATPASGTAATPASGTAATPASGTTVAPASGTGAPAATYAPGLATTYNTTFDNLTYGISSVGTLTHVTENAAGDISGQLTVDPPLYGSGPFTGTVNGNAIKFTVESTPNPVNETSGTFTGTIGLQDSLSGTYAGDTSTGPQNGNWTAVPAALPSAGSSQPDCSVQNPSECLLASNAVSALDTGADIEPPSGMTVLYHQVIPQEGFAAAAFMDANGNIIIADEGADLASPFGTATPYQNWSFAADVEIYGGAWPVALNDAVRFARYVQGLDTKSAPIYVTGFDLGGVEAQAQAQALQSGVAGGATFGAPGLPGNQAAGNQGALVNFVDYGDGIGNWTSDPGSALASLAPKHMDHYGRVDQIGNLSSAALPLLAANTHKLAADSLIDEAVGEDWGAGDAFDKILDIAPTPYTKAVKIYDTVIKGASYSYLAGSALLFHSIGQYATDLGVSLTPTVAPPTSPADYIKEFEPAASTATLMAADATTVSADGTVNGPSYNLTADTATDLLTEETYTAGNSSQYDVSYDPTEQVSSLQANDPGSTSYEIFNDDSSQYPWSTRVDFYSGPNETGTLTATLYNWHAGGSQLQVFTGLPTGDTKEILNYSQPDATGQLTSKQFE